jgi:putative transposase
VLGAAHGAKTKVIEPMAEVDKTKPIAAVLTEEQRKLAMKRFDVLRPHLEQDVPLAHAAQHAGVAVRTAERWLSPYRKEGLNGLARSVRSDANARHLSVEVVALIEGMGLKKPRASAAAIHRRISTMAKAQGWLVPSYSTVYAILADLDPGDGDAGA